MEHGPATAISPQLFMVFVEVGPCLISLSRHLQTVHEAKDLHQLGQLTKCSWASSSRILFVGKHRTTRNQRKNNQETEIIPLDIL